MHDNNLLSQLCNTTALSQHMIELNFSIAQNYDMIYYIVVIIIVYTYNYKSVIFATEFLHCF